MDIFNTLPLITDFPSRKHWEAAVWEILMERLAKVQSEKEIKKILDFLLSSREQHNFIFRAVAASRMKSGIGMREIGRELWLAFPTISAIKKSLSEDQYKSAHARGHKKKEYTVGKLTPRGRKFYRGSLNRGILPHWE